MNWKSTLNFGLESVLMHKYMNDRTKTTLGIDRLDWPMAGKDFNISVGTS